MTAIFIYICYTVIAEQRYLKVEEPGGGKFFFFINIENIIIIIYYYLKYENMYYQL